MCGIFLIVSRSGCFSDKEKASIETAIQTLQPRGPDMYQMLQVNSSTILAFHRLAINDLSPDGMQPFAINDTYTMCNGEIYNYHSLASPFSDKLKSRSDCEVLPHLIHTHSFDRTLEMLDGVFAMIHYHPRDEKIYFARDSLGVKPLFYATHPNWFAVSSEAKALDKLGMESIYQLPPSKYGIFFANPSRFQCVFFQSRIAFTPSSTAHTPTYEVASSRIQDLLVNAVRKRMTSDREIGCLLSGGLDSSLVASILANELKKDGRKLHTFSVGFPDSTDIVFARQVASHIQSEHHELVLSYEDALRRLPDVVRAVETYDTTTIRASTPMFLLCEWISKNFPHRVIFSGEGSDELFCGYLYFHMAPSPSDAQTDSFRLLSQLWQYDVLRADRCTASNGLEFREPFLDRDLLAYATSLPAEFVVPRAGYEKHLLRSGFSQEDLPNDVLWRRKAAFSDAVSGDEKPWYKWIHEFVGGKEITEPAYYKQLFQEAFDNYRPLVQLWLPKWVDVGQEPSATVLKHLIEK